MERSEFSLVCGAVNITVNVTKNAIWADDVSVVISDYKNADFLPVVTVGTVTSAVFVTINK